MLDFELRTHVTRRNFVRGVGLLGATAALISCAKPAAEDAGTKAGPLVAIIHTNDTHGHDVEVKATDNYEGNFSMAAVASLKSEWEKKGYEVLLVDAGDATQGMPLVDSSKGASGITFMNACGYDLMAVGNHEFDWGFDALQKNIAQAKFAVLSANVLNKETGELCFTPNKVVELASGTKIGFFGLTTPATMTTSNPVNVSQLTFLQDKDLFDCAQKQVDELRGKGCDLVVCVGHMGNESERGDNTSKRILQNVNGIDLFIDGHDHQEVEEEVEGTLLVETGCYLQNIGVVAIDAGTPKNEPVAYGTYEGVDASAQAVIDEENARVEKELGVVLGSTPFLLDGNRAPGVRTQETNLGDFIADAFKWTAEQENDNTIDAAIINGGAIRTSVEKGDISLKTIKSVVPFSNEVAVIKVTGAQLLEALEAGCQSVGSESPSGGFPQVSGITYTINSPVPYEQGPNYPDSIIASPAAPGSRVTISDVGGKGFNESETYSIATNSFICEGGDSYHAFKEASEAEDPVEFGFDYEAISSYLVVGCDHVVPDRYSNTQDRITIIE